MTGRTHSFVWDGPSPDPNDLQVGDRVRNVDLEDADAFDAVLLGEPYDGAVIGRRGAREGPVALRSALATAKATSFRDGTIPDLGDLGDVEIPDGTVSDVQGALLDVTRAVHQRDTLPVFLGGDNSTTVPNVSPLLEKGSTAVINFDAHLDCRAVEGEPTSGSPYRQLFERGLDGYLVVGARHFETSASYLKYVRDRGGTIIPADRFDTTETGVVADRIVDAVEEDHEHVYLSVDVDVLDNALVEGVSAPTPGGLTARELFRLLGQLGSRLSLSGFEVVECAPPLDPTDRTSRAASRAIAHLLAAQLGRSA
ncbi:MAG: agmatinase family protein [Halodesulfurarchaeum sp.]